MKMYPGLFAALLMAGTPVFQPAAADGCGIIEELEMIAHYPLTTTAVDTTGNYGDMTLINTPFQNGGIYCNGNYIYGDPDSCHAITPQIDGLTFEKFAVSAKFKVDEYSQDLNPVFTCGDGWRWMIVWLQPDSTVRFGYNGSFGYPTEVKYQKDTWHTATVTYDSTSGIGECYLDAVLVESTTFDIEHGNDKNVGITHFGSGITFKGIFGDLKIYSLPDSAGVEPSEKNAPRAGGFNLLQNHPNPFNPVTIIRFTLAERSHTTLEIFDITGKFVVRLVDGIKTSGDHSVVWNGDSAAGSPVSSGMYLCRLTAGDRTATKKMILVK